MPSVIEQRVVEALKQHPAVRDVATERADTIHVQTLVADFWEMSDEERHAIYATESELMRAFPDVSFNFHLVPSAN